MTNSGAKTILVVEDDDDIRLTVMNFLELEGYHVLGAENGRVALDLLDVTEPPHLILLDMKMPVMNGWQFAIEFLKRHDRRSPIAVMTAAADAEQRAREINAIGWIEKPFYLDDLLKKIKGLEASYTGDRSR